MKIKNRRWKFYIKMSQKWPTFLSRDVKVNVRAIIKSIMRIFIQKMINCMKIWILPLEKCPQIVMLFGPCQDKMSPATHEDDFIRKQQLEYFPDLLFSFFLAVDTCPKIPHLHNGRNIMVANSGGSAYHFKCNRGFKRYGVRNTHCKGERWSHGENWPICTSKCDSQRHVSSRDVT